MNFSVAPQGISLIPCISVSNHRRCVGVKAHKRHRNQEWEAGLLDETRHESPQQTIVTLFGKDGSIATIPPNFTSTPNAPEFMGFQKMDSIVSPSDLLDLRHEPSHLADDQGGLCEAKIFRVSATNGFDVSRRMNVFGFCQSLEYLAENIHNAIRMRGGEIAHVEGQHVSLCIPLLWGVPPEVERLTRSIEQGGGIIHKVYKEWFIF